MSKIVWDKLGKEHQEALRKAAAETVAFQRQKWDAYEIEALEKVKAGGVTVTPVSDLAPFKTAVKQLVAEESPKYAETIKAIDALRPKK